MISRSLGCFLALFLAADPVPQTAATNATQTHTVVIGAHKFTLPTGLNIELVAEPPLIERPIHADFDDDGHLFVAESSGSNDPVEKQLAEKPHRIVRLEDSNHDGKFDKRTIFADKLMFPEGLLWHKGSVYVAAPPSIWKLTDTNGNGVADERVEWFQGKTLTHCANDLHGPFVGPDGWIYWCKGAFAKQTYERPGKKPFVTSAAHLFRARPDGTGMEPVITGGMDNPVEVAFTNSGEIFFTTTFFQHPAGGKRDGLIHAIYGGVYGKDHNVINSHARTGELLPPMTHLGPAAPAGLCRLNVGLGRDFRYVNNLLVAQFNMHKVSRHVLKYAGPTFETSDFDFLTSDNLDFHPTDVLEAGLNVIVVNTGGWYKLCCPSSQLWKPDVLGGIYRIHPETDKRPRISMRVKYRKPPAELIKMFHDPKCSEGNRYIIARELEGQGKLEIELLQQLLKSLDSSLACDALWMLSRWGTAEAQREVRNALRHEDPHVIQAALSSVSLNRDTKAIPQLLHLLKRGDPQQQRVAAEALGRMQVESAVPDLLVAARGGLPRELEHAIIYALIEIGDREQTKLGLASTQPAVQRVTLIALDQMPDGRLTAEVVSPFFKSGVPTVRETAAWIATRHPEWANVLAPVLEQRIADERLTPKESEELAQQLTGFAKSSAIQNLLADVLRVEKWAKQGNAKRIAWQAMSQAPMKSLPNAWFDVLHEALLSQDTDAVSRAVEVLRKMPAEKEHWPALTAVLLRVAGQAKFSDKLRLDALSALPDLLVTLDDSSLKFVQQHLRYDAPVLQRLAAIDVVSRSKLTTAQLNELMFSLQITGPYEFERLLTPYSRSPGDEVLKGLIQTLKSSPGIVSVPPEKIQKLFAQGGPEIQKSAAVIVSALTEATKKDREKVESILALVPKGDARRGQLVFNSQKATCTACHALGYVGGRIGPDLSRVGRIRSERDLVESIIYPSASFVRSYEPIVVATKSGKTHGGLIKQESPEDVVVTVSAREEVRLRRDEIEEIHPGTVSLMPSGLDQQITPQELADLIVFLKAAK